MNIVCLIVDRLHIGYLGCYGNSWVGTPELDRLACESLCCDQALIDNPRLEQIYRSFWKGGHALTPAEHLAEVPSLMRLLSNAGIHSTLMTDDPLVAEHPLAADFDDGLLLDLGSPRAPVAELSETKLAKFFAAASEWLAEPREPFLLWLHTTGLGLAWDAPLEMRNQYTEEGDPTPPNTAEVPCRTLPEGFDPDELLAIRHSYAGQAALLDTCIGAMCDFLKENGLQQDTLLAVLSARGFPLGEHRLLGDCGDALHEELVHVPWLIRFPDGLGAAARTPSLVQPGDLRATVLEACGVTSDHETLGMSLMPLARGEMDRRRDHVCITAGDGERAIRTPAWHMRVVPPDQGGAEPRTQLFAKPDDRWECNEVSARCAEVVEGLATVLTDFEAARKTGSTSEPQPLDDVLLHRSN